jgi:hypothetical protein
MKQKSVATSKERPVKLVQLVDGPENKNPDPAIKATTAAGLFRFLNIVQPPISMDRASANSAVAPYIAAPDAKTIARLILSRNGDTAPPIGWP